MIRIAPFILLAAFAAEATLAADETFSLVVQDHRFEPAEHVAPPE
jgi:hypothetical protein